MVERGRDFTENKRTTSMAADMAGEDELKKASQINNEGTTEVTQQGDTKPKDSQDHAQDVSECSESKRSKEDCNNENADDLNSEEVANKENVELKIVYNRQKFDVTFPVDDTVAELKKHLQSLTGLPPAMQKVMFKGLAKDDKTLRELKVTSGAKMMVVGSTVTDLLSIGTPDPKELKKEEAAATASSKDPLCKQKMHKKVLDKGKPDDVMPGKKNAKDRLPPYPLSGMVNKTGGKVRLTFKLENDQLWIGTKERTEKVSMSSVKNVTSEPIEGHEEYHLMALQLGPTDLSKYWIYWVPAQYADSIKETIMGKWQYF